MESQDHKKSDQSSGHGVHFCHKCGWPFPNPHPRARHRRAHKKICGTIEGYKLGESGDKQHIPLDKDEHPSVEDHSKATQEGSKGVEISIAKRTSSGFGSRSSMSTTRSEDDVFSDAVMDFTEGSVVEDCSDGTKEQASTLKIIAENVENLVDVGGKLCSENTSLGSQLQEATTTQCPEPEIDKVKNVLPSECLPSSTNDSVCSDLGAGREDGKVTGKFLSSSAVSSSHDFDKKGSKEQGDDEAPAELVPTANAVNIINAFSSPHEVIRDSLGPTSVDPLLQTTGRQEIGLGVKDVCYPEVDSQAVNEVNPKQDTCIRSTEEDLSSPINVPDDLPLKQQPEKMHDNFENQRAGKFISSSPEPSEEVKVLGQDVDSVCNEVYSVTTPVDGPDSNAEIMSKDVRSDVVDSGEVTPAEAVVREGMLGERVNPPGIDIRESEIATIHQQVDHEQDFQGKKFDSAEEEKSLTVCDDSSKLDRVVKSGEVINTVHDDGSRFDTDFQFYNDEKNERSQKSKSSKEQKSLVLSDETLQNLNRIPSVQGVEAVPDNDNCDERETQSCHAAEAGGAAQDDRILLEADKACSIITDHVASEVDRATNLIGVNEEGDCSAVGTVEKEKSFASKLDFNDKVDAEKSFSDDQMGSAPSSTVEDSDFLLKNLQDVHEGDASRGNSVEKTVGEEGNKSIEGCAVSSLGNKYDVVQDVSNVDVSKVSDLAGVHPSDVNENISLEDSDGTLTNPATSLEKAQETKKSDGNEFGRESVGKVDLGLISDHDDDTDSIKNTAKEAMQSQIDIAPSVHESAAVESTVTKEEEATKTVNDSVRIQGDMKLDKHDDIVSALDYQADSSSQTDSLEGNWGSVSVVSAFSDIPPGNDKTPPPSQRSVEPDKDILHPGTEVKAGCDGSELSGFKDMQERNDQKDSANEVEPQEKPQEQVDESLGRKKNEEIIAKVTNWSSDKQHSGKQHMPLKSLLGEPDHMDDIPTDSPAKTDKGNHDNQKSPTGEASKGVGKEWNSPARYPSNIKREKNKVRSKPYWAPFICCSSIETS